MLDAIYGGVDSEILGSAADEVLAAIKQADVTDKKRKANVEELVGPVPDSVFNELYKL